jgi:AraC-like DNA-binding protein
LNESGIANVLQPRPRLVPTHTIRQSAVQLSAVRPVRAQFLEVRSNVAPHDHDYYEICVAHSGSALHQTDSYDLPFKSGSVVVIAPGQTHAFAQVKNLTVTNVYYLAEWLLTDLRSLWEHDGLVPLFLAASLFRRPMWKVGVPHFSLQASDAERCYRELEDATRELAMPNPSVVFLKSTLLKFLIGLSRSYALDQQSRELGFGFRREIWMAMDQIEEIIRQSTPFSVEDLATQSGLSTDHLSRVFKEATGWAPMDYFQRRRIHHACTWLLNPRNSITEVAYALGFADTAHFSRLFRRYQGTSPRAYRKMYLK